MLLYLFYQADAGGLPASRRALRAAARTAVWAQQLILPWITLALVTAATYTRLTRGAMLDVLGEDYIRTARAKGMSGAGSSTGTGCAAR